MGIVCREFCCVSAAALTASLQISARTSSSSSEENFVSKNWFDYMSRSGSTRCLVFRGGGGHFPSQRKNRRRHQVAERDLTNHRRRSSRGKKKLAKGLSFLAFLGQWGGWWCCIKDLQVQPAKAARKREVSACNHWFWTLFFLQTQVLQNWQGRRHLRSTRVWWNATQKCDDW